MSYGYQPTPIVAPPAKFQSLWFYSYYTQIQHQQLHEMSAWFRSIDKDRSGSISAMELQHLQVGYGPLGIETSTKLIRVFDVDKSGQIDFYEYAALHQFINILYANFLANDRNRSGTIDAHEIHRALGTTGFNLPFHTVNLLFLKVSPRGYGLKFSDFLGLCSTIAIARSLFEAHDPMRTGIAHLNINQLYDIVSLV
ncbi:hypothetical protein RB653_009606 [Dictyostelium firmibasis]|uniref:EF-hand domain-containing protein n=1 Tax=Dictyostelium firmibasis TaxID=79012 RepID=A0AAN7TVU0_9MYCE